MGEHQKLVGPVLGNRELAEAVIAAAERDNPDVEIFVEDRVGYIRIHAPGRFRLTQKSLSEALGYPIRLPEIEPHLVSFAGRMKYLGDEELIFYLEREDGR
jgi:toluene monooxygenase system protein D